MPSRSPPEPIYTRKSVEEAVTREPAFARLWAKRLAAEFQRAWAQVEIISLKGVGVLGWVACLQG